MSTVKTRSIKTSFWRDPKIKTYDSDTKYVFNYLLQSPESNMIGIYEISLLTISEDTSLPPERVEKALDNLVFHKRIIVYNSWITILNFIKHQDFTSENHRRGVINRINEIPKSVLLELKNHPFWDETLYPLVASCIDGINENNKGRVFKGGKPFQALSNPLNNFTFTLTSTLTPTPTSTSSKEDNIYTPPKVPEVPKKEPVTYTQEFKLVFEKWNGIKVVVHKEPTENMVKRFKKLRDKKYEVGAILHAIYNYGSIYHSKKHFFDHQWKLEEFLAPKNIDRFSDDLCQTNLMHSQFKNKKDNVLNNEKQNYRET